MTRSGGRGEWSKPAIILAILSIVSNLGWAIYGMSQKSSAEVEQRIRALEITVATLGVRMEARR